MRARLVSLLVLLLALAVPLQGLLASAWPGKAKASDVSMTQVADQGGHEDAAPCPGHDAAGDAGATGESGDSGCACCVVCGAAALPAGATVVAANELSSTTAAAAPAVALAFVTEGPERPPRG